MSHDPAFVITPFFLANDGVVTELKDTFGEVVLRDEEVIKTINKYPELLFSVAYRCISKMAKYCNNPVLFFHERTTLNRSLFETEVENAYNALNLSGLPRGYTWKKVDPKEPCLPWSPVKTIVVQGGSDEQSTNDEIDKVLKMYANIGSRGNHQARGLLVLCVFGATSDSWDQSSSFRSLPDTLHVAVEFMDKSVTKDVDYHKRIISESLLTTISICDLETANTVFFEVCGAMDGPKKVSGVALGNIYDNIIEQLGNAVETKVAYLTNMVTDASLSDILHGGDQDL